MDRIAMLQEILAQNPNDSLARYGLAMEFANTGESETALSEFARLLAANPDYTAAYQMSGQILMRLGREDEAGKMLQEGVASAVRTRNQHARAEMEAMLDELR